jgi:hypothetical protein
MLLLKFIQNSVRLVDEIPAMEVNKLTNHTLDVEIYIRFIFFF